MELALSRAACVKAMNASSLLPSPLRQSIVADEVVINERCSFDTQAKFTELEAELRRCRSATRMRNIARKTTSFAMPIATQDELQPFKTAMWVEGKFELKNEAARKNNGIKEPYVAPSDHCFREESPQHKWKAPHDFQTKFTLPSNQDLRRRVALDQEGFFVDDDGVTKSPSKRFVRAIEARSPNKHVKAAFVSRVDHTSRKYSNVELRLERILDEEGLLPNLEDVRRHKYREEVSCCCCASFIEQLALTVT
ncbi:TPA: hypothetical protein N0F65_001504 [Lagenidium giganteum]|uniref:Uncharacterized protein n=1 Tax=Lagenidium giganteum TaxID=4803 RepID=A0AAV2Z2P1_9STRA|nr:TPA: hypothetical protein N0F65_001504 [Lagenidium giganteum]